MNPKKNRLLQFVVGPSVYWLDYYTHNLLRTIVPILNCSIVFIFQLQRIYPVSYHCNLGGCPDLSSFSQVCTAYTGGGVAVRVLMLFVKNYNLYTGSLKNQHFQSTYLGRDRAGLRGHKTEYAVYAFHNVDPGSTWCHIYHLKVYLNWCGWVLSKCTFNMWNVSMYSIFAYSKLF